MKSFRWRRGITKSASRFILTNPLHIVTILSRASDSTLHFRVHLAASGAKKRDSCLFYIITRSSSSPQAPVPAPLSNCGKRKWNCMYDSKRSIKGCRLGLTHYVSHIYAGERRMIVKKTIDNLKYMYVCRTRNLFRNFVSCISDSRINQNDSLLFHHPLQLAIRY